MTAKKSRRRGVVLSLAGQHKFEAARRQLEQTLNGGDRFTLEELSARTQLALSTITRVLEAQFGVDKQTLDQMFAAFDLLLERTDYQHPERLDPALPLDPVSQDTSASALTSEPVPVIDWGEAIDVSRFYGRTKELTTLEQWVHQDRCRLIGLLGMGGIGKTALSVKLAQELIQNTLREGQSPTKFSSVAAQSAIQNFEFIVWRTLRNTPPLELLLTDLIQVLSCQRESLPSLPIPALLSRLLHYLRQHRCLLILDNGETILQSGQFTGAYRSGYEAYGELLRQVGEISHQSCLVLTSREKPETIANLEGDILAVRSLALTGLPISESDQLFDVIGLSPSPLGRHRLMQVYSGNPLALKIVATSIRELFEGDVDAFLSEETTVFNGIRRLLDQQYQRLTQLEIQVMIWLAINREWTTIAELQANIVPSAPKQRLLETLESLARRSLIEQKQARFTQQPVVMEYMTDELIEQVCKEICQRSLQLFISHALIKASTKEYVRESQIRVILTPLGDRLLAHFGSQPALIAQLKQLLNDLHASTISQSGYGAGNLLNLLHHFKADLTGYDFSQLTIRQACLQNAPLHQVKLTRAHVIACQFAEPMRHPSSMAVSTQGDRMAIGGEDGVIQIWQVSTGQPLSAIQAHSAFIFALTFSQNGQTLVSGGADKLMRFWDVASGKCLQNCPLAGPVWALAMSPDGQLLAGATSDADRSLYLWDGKTGEHLKTLTGHTGQASSLAFIPCDRAPIGWLLVSGSQDCTLKIWDIEQGTCLRTLIGHTSMAMAVGVHPQGKLLASGSFDHSIKLWDWRTGECLQTLLGHTAEVNCISFSWDGHLLASGSSDYTIRLWDVATGECLQVLQGHRDHVWELAFTTNPDQEGTPQQMLVSASFDRTIRFWHISQQSPTPSPTPPTPQSIPEGDNIIFPRTRTITSYCLKTIQGSTMGIRTLACHPQEGLLASAGLDTQVWLWNQDGKCLKVLKGHTAGIWKVAFHPRDRLLASASLDGEIKLWHIDTGSCLRTLRKNSSWIQAMSFSPQGYLINGSSSDAAIWFWDSQTGECFRRITLEADAYLLGLAFHPQGNYFVTAGNDDRLRWWDIESGECLRIVEGNNGGHAWCVAFHPQGHLFASLGNDHSVNLWDAERGERCQTLEGHTGVLGSLAFSADGSILASGRSDRTIRLWDVTAGQCLSVLEGHTSGITAVAFLPSHLSAAMGTQGQILASGSLDETIRLWDVQTGKCLRMFHPERLYEDMDMTGIVGLIEAQKAMLKQLGAIET